VTGQRGQHLCTHYLRYGWATKACTFMGRRGHTAHRRHTGRQIMNGYQKSVHNVHTKPRPHSDHVHFKHIDPCLLPITKSVPPPSPAFLVGLTQILLNLASLSVRILPSTSIPSVHQASPMLIKDPQCQSSIPPWAHTCRSVMARPRMRAWMSWVPSYVFTASRFITWRMTDARHEQERSRQQQKQHMHKVILEWSTAATATTTTNV
jgi:hypothetical protein